MRRLFAIAGFACAMSVGAAVLAVIPSAPSQAASVGTFVVPANDGYGVGDCVASGSGCGQIVADSWCEAQGYARSASFGFVDVEVTGSIGTAVGGRPVSITCSR